MTKKDDKKPSEKEVYRLWWEYLKRSNNFQAYCDVVRKYMRYEYKKKGKKYLTKNIPLTFSQVSRIQKKVIQQFYEKSIAIEKQNNFKILLCTECMERNWLTFGDVFDSSFDDWWTTQETQDFSVPLVVLNEPGALAKLSHFVKECKRIKKEKGKNPTPEEVIEILIDQENEYLFIAVPMVGKMTMNDISKKIGEVRAKWKNDDKFVLSDQYFKRYFMPVSRIRFDELQRYLKVYDLKKQGLKIKEIIYELDPSKRCNDGDTQRIYRSFLQKAKKVIKNVEYGFFPEVPPDK